MEAWIQHLIELLALPEYGLSTVFIVSFISATLLPLGSEPVVFGLVKLNPAMFWPAVLVATTGNTLGGALCAVAGWLKFPLWPCLAYMAVGKFLRYFLMTGGLVWAFPGVMGVMGA